MFTGFIIFASRAHITVRLTHLYKLTASNALSFAAISRTIGLTCSSGMLYHVQCNVG